MLGVEKPRVSSQSKEACLRVFYFPPPCKEASEEESKDDLCPRPQIKQPVKEGAGALKM